MKKLEDIVNKIVSSRELKKKKIEEVSGILNIKLDFLRLIEAGELSKIETNIYSKGHIRTYLDWLEVDPQPLLNFIDGKEEKKNKIKNQQSYFKIHKLAISKKYIILICLIILYLIIYSWDKLFLKDSNIIAHEIKSENSDLETKITQPTERI
jgi:cytoskeletal protein RodZ